MKSTLREWINQRFPLNEMWQKHFVKYYAPKNFNFWYFFGSLALAVFLIQLVSGIWLTMFYTPTANEAFASIETIMRDVPFGWLLRYLHSTGASAFFIVIYLHMFRALLYGSYKKPRELVWLFGVSLYIILLSEAFMGYLLPWGQMSYWAAQVIVSLLSAIPGIGEQLVMWVRGDFNVSGVTLNRFFALHVTAVPLILIAFIVSHITALHEVGSNNPDGIDIKENVDGTGKPLDGIPFHPYYTVKDLFGFAIFLFIFAFVVFYSPTLFGYFLEPDNFAPANPLVTPSHIAPVWYMTPYYAMLRAVPDKLFGVIILFCAILVWFFVPWLDRSSVRSMRYRGPWSRAALAIFVISFISLGYLGTVNVTELRGHLARLFTSIYFLFFILMPIYSAYDRNLPVPTRVTT